MTAPAPSLELEIYRRAFQAISEANVEGALRGTLEAMVEVARADRGFVLVREAGAPPLILARTVARSAPSPEEGPSEAIVARALESRVPVRIENALEEPEFRGRPSVLALSVLSVLAVPIVAQGEALAVVYLDSMRLAGIFTPESEAAALRLAAAVAPGIRAAARLKQAEERERRLRARLLAIEEEAPQILGRNPKFTAALDRAVKAAPTGAPVLLEGESGTGKELFARAVHRASARAGEPFVAINCGAIPEGTLEAELFGYLRGAFTGATQDRAGRLEAADRGTVFLDEVGDMPPALQVKLLRVLQSGEIQKLGDVRQRRVDVRVVAATHRDLRALVKEGRFREDLYYRLRVVGVTIPPLRERGDDVLLLAEALAQRFGRELKKPIAGLTSAAREALLKHPFPGNVRELENAIRHAAVFGSGTRLGPEDLPSEIRGEERGLDPRAPSADAPPRDAEELRRAKEEAQARVERAFLVSLLSRAGGNVSRAARLADMNRSVLHELIARHAVLPQDFKRDADPDEGTT